MVSADNVTMDKTTMDEIQNKYGKTSIFRSGIEDESNKQVCYNNKLKKGEGFIIFEFGAMGGFNRVTGIRIFAENGGEKCAQTITNLFDIVSGNGGQLGQSRKVFLKRFKISFKRIGERLIYQGESKREANKEELNKLHKWWPSEKQTFFDVTTTVRASFKDDRQRGARNHRCHRCRVRCLARRAEQTACGNRRRRVFGRCQSKWVVACAQSQHGAMILRCSNNARFKQSPHLPDTGRDERQIDVLRIFLACISSLVIAKADR